MMRTRLQVVRPTPVTLTAITGIACAITFSLAFLLSRYSMLPDLLPVRFGPFHTPVGWQWKTYPRVLIPVFVQFVLALVCGAVSALVLSRSHGPHDEIAEDVRAARAAAEAVALFALIWVVFQAYAAYALARMWETGIAGLGPGYKWFMAGCTMCTLVVARRAQVQLGRPEPREYVPEHWRLGQLYRNPADPALFVPTRDGSRWTLNFGRPVAAALIAIVLVIGIVGPAVILRLLLR